MDVALQILNVVSTLGTLIVFLVVRGMKSDLANLPAWLRFLQGGLAALDPRDGIPVPTPVAADDRDTNPGKKRAFRPTRVDTPPPFPVITGPVTPP